MSYGELYGKVLLPPAAASGSHFDLHGRHVPTAGTLVVHDADGTAVMIRTSSSSAGAAGSQSPAVPPLRSYAEWYVEHSDLRGGGEGGGPLPLRAVVSAAHFQDMSESAGRPREAELWALVGDVLEDAERSSQYDAAAIGIAGTQPQRRWFITHYAHIQDLLMRNATLRRACVVCRWLERTYRQTQPQQPRLRGEEDVVLRQLLLTFLRGGELGRAIDASIHCEDASYSCVLSAAQLQTVKEPWFTQTATVPLFGEYAHGELDQAWCGNEHRLDNLSQLYEDSVQYARPEAGPRHGFDAVIGAALCGNLSVLEPAFAVSGSWRDVAWCYLRCMLTVAFSKTLVDGGAAVEGPYRTFLEQQTGGDDNWLDPFVQQLVRGLTARLEGAFLAKAPLEEQVQMRYILQVLSPDDVSWLDVDLQPPAGDGPDWGADAHQFKEAVRIFTHLLLVLDAAYNESLSTHAVQAFCGDALASALARYAAFLAVLPRYPFDEGMAAAIALASRLRSHHHRASIYAAFLRAARQWEMERQTLSRDRLEEQEAQLVRMFVEADPAPDVHAEVQRLLNQQVPLDDLLTHNKLAEQIMWGAMHADSRHDHLATLRQGLEACVQFWLTEPEAELDAITDVSRVLMRRVVPFLKDDAAAAADGAAAADAAGAAPAAPAAAAMSDLEENEATFWYLFSECRDQGRRHTRTAAELAAARAATSSDRTLLLQLAQDEVAEMRRMAELTQRAARHGGAVVHRSRGCLTAIIWLVQQLTEDATLALLNGGPGRDELALMQTVFALVEELDEAGYLEPALLPRANAAELYDRVRTMRVTYGQRVHWRHVQAALKEARSAAGGSREGGAEEEEQEESARA